MHNPATAAKAQALTLTAKAVITAAAATAAAATTAAATAAAAIAAVSTSPLALPTPMEHPTIIPIIIVVLLHIHTPISATTHSKTKLPAHTPATVVEATAQDTTALDTIAQDTMTQINTAHMAQEVTVPMDQAPRTRLSPIITHTTIAEPSRITTLHTNLPHHTAHMALDIEPPHTRLSLITTHTIIAEPSHTTTLRTETQLAMVPAHTAHPANKIVLSQSNNTRNTSKTPSSSDLMAKAVKVERWVSSAKATVETVLTHGRDKLLAALQSS